MLKSKKKEGLGYNQCTREWGKDLKPEQHGGVVANGLMISNSTSLDYL
jgi:hypothetical protein